MSFWQSLAKPIIGMAPMDGVTDVTFRHTVAMHGKPDVSFTEFTHVGTGILIGLSHLSRG